MIFEIITLELFDDNKLRNKMIKCKIDDFDDPSDIQKEKIIKGEFNYSCSYIEISDYNPNNEELQYYTYDSKYISFNIDYDNRKIKLFTTNSISNILLVKKLDNDNFNNLIDDFILEVFPKVYYNEIIYSINITRDTIWYFYQTDYISINQIYCEIYSKCNRNMNNIFIHKQGVYSVIKPKSNNSILVLDEEYIPLKVGESYLMSTDEFLDLYSKNNIHRFSIEFSFKSTSKEKNYYLILRNDNFNYYVSYEYNRLVFSLLDIALYEKILYVDIATLNLIYSYLKNRLELFFEKYGFKLHIYNKKQIKPNELIEKDYIENIDGYEFNFVEYNILKKNYKEIKKQLNREIEINKILKDNSYETNNKNEILTIENDKLKNEIESIKNSNNIINSIFNNDFIRRDISKKNKEIENVKWKYYNNYISNMIYYNSYLNEYKDTNVKFYNIIFNQLNDNVKIAIVGGGNGIDAIALEEFLSCKDIESKIDLNIIDKTIWPVHLFSEMNNNKIKLTVSRMSLFSFIDSKIKYDYIIFSRIINFTDILSSTFIKYEEENVKGLIHKLCKLDCLNKYLFQVIPKKNNGVGETQRFEEYLNKNNNVSNLYEYETYNFIHRLLKIR